MARNRKRKQKQKKGGVLSQITSAFSTDHERITYDDILSGKYPVSDDLRKDFTSVWDSIRVATEGSLIREARGYGYPLQSVVDYYVCVYTDDYDDASELTEQDIEDAKGNLEYLKNVSTWEDFEVVIEALDDPTDQRPADMFPLVPQDLAHLIIDQRLIAKKTEAIVAAAHELPEDDVVLALCYEDIRQEKDLSVEFHARCLDTNVEIYKEWIKALESRANNDYDLGVRVRKAKKMGGLNRRMRARSG